MVGDVLMHTVWSITMWVKKRGKEKETLPSMLESLSGLGGGGKKGSVRLVVPRPWCCSCDSAHRVHGEPVR